MILRYVIYVSGPSPYFIERSPKGHLWTRSDIFRTFARQTWNSWSWRFWNSWDWLLSALDRWAGCCKRQRPSAVLCTAVFPSGSCIDSIEPWFQRCFGSFLSILIATWCRDVEETWGSCGKTGWSCACCSCWESDPFWMGAFGAAFVEGSPWWMLHAWPDFFRVFRVVWRRFSETPLEEADPSRGPTIPTIGPLKQCLGAHS